MRNTDSLAAKLKGRAASAALNERGSGRPEIDGAPAPVGALGEGDVLLTRREAAEYLRRSVPTLERWAAHGIGPPHRKVGGRVLYPLPGLRRFASGDEQPLRAA